MNECALQAAVLCLVITFKILGSLAPIAATAKPACGSEDEKLKLKQSKPESLAEPGMG